jgi:hypothetical protein
MATVTQSGSIISMLDPLLLPVWTFGLSSVLLLGCGPMLGSKYITGQWCFNSLWFFTTIAILDQGHFLSAKP